MFNCIVCDDDPIVVDKICNTIQVLYSDAIRCYKAYSKQDLLGGSIPDIESIDLLLMDIEIDNDNGIDITKELLSWNSKLKVIFVSAYHKYAQDIFDVNPVYYVQKPYTENTLKKAIDKALFVSDSREMFFFTKGGTVLSIPYKDIVFFESDRRIVKVHTLNDSDQFYARLKDVENSLDSRFLRCHHSYLVNMDHITGVTSTSIRLEKDLVVPISQSKSKSIRDRFTLYLGKRLDG